MLSRSAAARNRAFQAREGGYESPRLRRDFFVA